MAGSDSLSDADVNRLLRVSNSQSECALKKRVRQMDHSPQLDIMTHMHDCNKRVCVTLVLKLHVNDRATHFADLSCGL